MGAALLDLVDLVLPGRCVGCRLPSPAGWCRGCRPHGPPLVSDALGFPVAAAGDYDGAVREALLAYKERGRRDLARALAGALVPCLRAVGVGAAVLVPVPSSAAARRARGGDHVLRLARSAGRRLGVPVRPAVRLGRRVRDSAGLDTGARATNLRHAMSAAPPGSIRFAVLVDDIVTTGATLAEAARALTDAGWTVSAAAVVAATVRRDGADRWRVPSGGSSVGMT